MNTALRKKILEIAAEYTQIMPQNFTISFPPCTGNTMWRVGRGRKYLNPEFTKWRSMVWAECLAQRVRMIRGEVRLSAYLGKPDKRQRDLDNYAKVILDALKGIAFEDDSKITKLVLEWANVSGVSVTVEAV